jgi:hypothetical protein
MCQVRLCTEPDVPKVRSCGDPGILLQSCEIIESLALRLEVVVKAGKVLARASGSKG